MGGKNIGPIRVEGDIPYVVQTSAILAQIQHWHAGRAAIEKIRAHGKVVIKPYTAGDFNAAQDPRGDRVVLDKPERGWGPGRIEVETLVLFSPSTFAAVVIVGGVWQPNANFNLPGAQGDEVLFHELVHASRYLGGDMKQVPLKGTMSGYDDEEEFFAVLISNIYISEKGRPATSLRQDHHGFNVLPASKNTSDTFLYADDNYRLIEHLCKQQPVICKMLRASPAKFNPIRAYLDQGVIDLKTFEADVPVPTRLSQNVSRPPLTDDYLISLLKPRFRANDVAGYGARARKLESVFAGTNRAEALPLSGRLIARRPGDLVAAYFHYHLSTPTRDKLLKTLNTRLSHI